MLWFLVSYYEIFFFPFLWNWTVFLVSKATYFLLHPIFSMQPKLQNVAWPIVSFQFSFTCKAEVLRACLLIFSLIEAAFSSSFFIYYKLPFLLWLEAPTLTLEWCALFSLKADITWDVYVYGVKLLSIDCFLGALFYCPSISWNVLGLNHHNLNCLDTNSLSNCYWQRKHKEICSDSSLDSITQQWLSIPIFLLFATFLALRREIGWGEAYKYII